MEIPFILVGGIILLGIVAIAALFLLKRKELEKTPADGKYPKGHFLNQGIAMGIPLGLPIGLAMGNISLGLPIGLGIGYAIGASMEEKNKDKIVAYKSKAIGMAQMVNQDFLLNRVEIKPTIIVSDKVYLSKAKEAIKEASNV